MKKMTDSDIEVRFRAA